MKVSMILLVVVALLEHVGCAEYPTVKPGPCADGSSPLPCRGSPCLCAKCPNFPNAECRDDLCKCEATFFVGDRDVTQQCLCQNNPPHQCPDGSYPVQCKISPCSVRDCPRHPNATCVDDYCGGCYARFYHYGLEVTNDCCICKDPPVNECPKADQVSCIIRPCDPSIAFCPNIPSASCFDEYCKSCRDRWFLPNCTEVTELCSRKP